KPPCAPGNAAAVNCSGVVESLRLLDGETRCDGWLELAISTEVWRRVPGELFFLRNFSKLCWELGCGGLDKGKVVPGTVYVWDTSGQEKDNMSHVLQTIRGMTTVPTKRPEGLPSYLFTDSVDIRDLQSWTTTAPAGTPHGAEIV
ncbi:SRCRM protein, partial [Toxostoma redivivum]|nr:SRCRM protein [Toxostoma redivivum]